MLASAILCLTALFMSCGLLMHGTPSDPDTAFGGAQTAGAFFVFASWALSTWAWGSRLCSVAGFARAEVFLEIALGSAGAALTGGALAHLGLIGERYQVLFILLTLLGPLILFAGQRAGNEPGFSLKVLSPRALRFNADTVLIGVLAFLALTAIAGGFDTLGPGQSDEQRYHLVGPKLWTDAGRFFFSREIPIVMQCSYWEYLFVWANSLLGASAGTGLFETQFFARWTHAVLGFGGTSLALSALFKDLAPTKRWSYAATIAAVSIPLLSYTPKLAKNDFGANLWAIAAATLLFIPLKPRRRQWLVTGLLLGLATGAKFPVLFTASALCLIWFVVKPQERKNAPLLLFGAMLGLLPVLLRNWLATGNPVYPSMSSAFGSSWIGPYVLEHQESYGVGAMSFDYRDLWAELKDLFFEVPYLIALFLAPLLGTDARNKLRPFIWASALATAAFLVVLRTGRGGVLRLAGPSLLLLAGVSVLSLGQSVVRLGKTRHLELAMIALIIACSLHRASFDWNAWPRRASMEQNHVGDIRNEPGGIAKAWLRMNASPSDLVLTTGDDWLYYVTGLNVSSIPNQPQIGWQTHHETSPKRVLESIIATRARYLLDTFHWSGSYWSRMSQRLFPILSEHPEARVVMGSDSAAFDLERLRETALASCVDQAPVPDLGPRRN